MNDVASIESKMLDVLTEILRWTKASSYHGIKSLLEEALPEQKHRIAYQLLDGSSTIQQVKSAAGMGQDAVYAIINKCCSMGLMERIGKKAVRTFDLRDFGMIEESNSGMLEAG